LTIVFFIVAQRYADEVSDTTMMSKDIMLVTKSKFNDKIGFKKIAPAQTGALLSFSGYLN